MKHTKILIFAFFIFLICGFALVILKPILKQNVKIVSLKNRLRDGFWDNLKVACIKFTTPEENLNTTRLPVYSLWVKPKKLDILNSNLPQSGRNYVSGEFDYLGRDYKAKFRYRGDMPWHWNSLQKSWRIRFKKGNLFNNRSDINLNNPEREVIDEALEFWLARKMNILAPECKIVHLRLNGQYLGVFIDIENIDEHFLKNNGQESGNVYFGEQGDAPYENYVNIWRSAAHWTKKISVNEKAKNDTSDLRNFIRVVNCTNQDEFKEQIEKITDLDGILTYIAFIDIGSSEHIGNVNNNKLYFVPSTGKLKLIAWDMSGHWTDENSELEFERRKNDFWLRLLDVPEFRERKNKILWESLKGAASTTSQLNFIEQTYNLIRDDIYSDKYKDTYFLKPMTNADFDRRVLRLKDWVRKRNTLITGILKASRLYVFDRQDPAENKNILKKLEFVSNNESGVIIKSIKIPLNIIIPKGSIFKLWYDKNHNGILDDTDTLISKSNGYIDFNVNQFLLNGIEIIDPQIGYTRAQYQWIDLAPRLLPTSFDFFITLSGVGSKVDYSQLTGVKLKSEDIIAKNSITGDATEVIVSALPGYSRMEGVDLTKITHSKGKAVEASAVNF